MDEYIPQLTLTPDLNAQPQPEVKQEADLITKAQAAPEAGPDLSALSEQEQQAVLAFSKQIDLENAQQILEYGASAQKNIADFSDTALAKVKTGDLGEIGDMLSGLLVELKTMDEPEKKGIAGLFRKAKINAEEMKSRFATAEVNVDRISGELEKHKITLLKDVAVMDQMYERNLQYFKELTMYILAGKQKLAEARSTTLHELRAKAEASNLPEDAQAANDFENKCVRFEKKLHDLELTRMISLQTAPQIRMIQNNDTALVEKIQTSVLNTIPLWKNQMVLTLGIENSRRAMEAQRQVTDMTNALLQKNADMLHMASVETAKESERGIVDMETLKHTNEQLISTLDEVLQIQTDGAKKRQEAEAELRRLEGELKQKLLQPRSSHFRRSKHEILSKNERCGHLYGIDDRRSALHRAVPGTEKRTGARTYGPDNCAGTDCISNTGRRADIQYSGRRDDLRQVYPRRRRTVYAQRRKSYSGL